ncbi:glycosyltransferase [Ottowia beijingensis]|uniref:Glycosyltransferase n=1 Tax=Ottowia beijingensis TaxID=1207057 RepID=A0A853IVA4_9BURK|nr:glycosyltransferase [Ottowia beijingensis]NZA01911.1 glycosyltransferase [Ottowia beijingensis]
MNLSEHVPQISVIIPVFNDLKGLTRCLQRLADQQPDTSAFEVIVVDNGSTPPIEVAAALPFPVKLVRHETPGSYAARNAGVRASSADGLAFTDADCLPAPDWLRAGHAALLAGNGGRIVGGEVLFTPESKPTAVAMYQQLMGFGQDSNVKEKGFTATANLFCTRAQFDATGPFEERLLSGGDREWCWRATKQGFAVCYTPEAVVMTPARSSLRSAMKQARRVVAGRRSLRQLGLAHAGTAALAKQRSAWQAVGWILSNQDIGFFDRLRVLFVAVLIRVVAMLESLRLMLGGKPERL